MWISDMKDKIKENKDEVIKTLQRKNKELHAQLASTYHFASANLKGVTYPRLMASGVLIEMHLLGGKQAVLPVVIRGGLSEETVAALTKDLVRSYEESIELKP
jgi:hypothetical protein